MPNLRWGTNNRGARFVTRKAVQNLVAGKDEKKWRHIIVYLPESSCLTTWDIALLPSAYVKEHDECSQV